jgi:hypothetical protein
MVQLYTMAMLAIAGPYILSTLGSAVPIIGGFVTDVLAFTGAGVILDDIVKFASQKKEVQQPDNKQEIDITPEPEDIKNISESISESDRLKLFEKLKLNF